MFNLEIELLNMNFIIFERILFQIATFRTQIEYINIVLAQINDQLRFRLTYVLQY